MDARTAAFVDKLLAPLPADDRLDRRAFIEGEDRKAVGLAYAMEWLRKNYPQRGKEA